MLQDEALNDDVILLILANKQDLPNAMSAKDVTDKLSSNEIKNRIVYPSNNYYNWRWAL